MVSAGHDVFDALHLLAVVQSRLGKKVLALASCDRALAVRPDHAEVLSNRGNILKEMKRLDEALASYDRALTVRPDHAEALSNRGVTLHELKRLEEALASYDRALAVRPNFAEALSNRGNVLKELNRLDEALASCDRALAVRPNYAEALSNRGVVLHELKWFDEALASYGRALAVRPNYAEALYNRGNTLKELKRHDEALASYDRALAVRPDYAEALSNRGVAFHELGRLDESLASYDRALSVRPDDAEALSNRGNTLTELHRFDEALASYHRALAVRPDYAQAHHNLAHGLLLTGDFERGFEHYEWRWETEHSRNDKPDFVQPLWRGENIAGKTVLLHAEQGLGDTIQFCRYARLMSERGADVILQVQPPLKHLLSGIAGPRTVLVREEPLPPFELHCPLLSLPLAFGTRLETIPPCDYRMNMPPQLVRHWEAKLGPKRKLRVGLVWSGAPGHKNDRNRSIPLNSLLGLLKLPVQVVSLQKEPQADDRSVLDAHKADVAHFGSALTDFAETAALASLMDVVVSVDTSVAHLAGALRRPTWIMLPYTPDWRWLIDRDDSPWYPTARLFRQDDTRAWDGVIDRIHQALLQFAKGLGS
jgi:tetratricopeptide (TPR) repeat protein